VTTGERRYSVTRRFASGPLVGVAGSAAFVPCLLGIVLIALLGAMEGGYFATTWYAAALFLLALLALLVAVVPRERRPPAAVTAAVALLFAYALWSYLSILWADDQGSVVDGAGRALMYAIVFALFALRPMSGGPALALVGAYGLVVGVVGLVELVRLGAAADPSGYFLDRRLAEPFGYHNGNVAFWFSGFWPCAYLASRRELTPPLRALLLGLAGILLGLALMGQSRGWLFSVPVVLIALVAIVPGRGRLVCALVALAVAGLAVRSPVLRVHDDVAVGTGLVRLVDDAVRAIELAALGLGAAGLVAALLDARVALSARTARRISAGVVAAAAAAVALGVGGVLVRADDPVGAVRDAWDEFKRGDLPRQGETRFTASLGSGRYDIWRVGWELFEEHPVAGVGADNYQQDYLQRAETNERPRFPHSLELRLLSQTGVVGALLFAFAMAAAAFAAFRARLRGPPLTRVAVAGALLVPLYWLVHGSVDWFYELPALAAAAFAMLGLAAGSAPRPERTERPGPLSVTARVGLGLAAAIAALVLLVPWLAERDMRAAAQDWRASPQDAFERLDRAKTLAPLSPRPYLYEAAIALRLDRVDRARDAYAEALRLNPRDWYSTLELGVLASMRGDRESATGLLERAVRLLPGDRPTRAALRAVRAGRRVDIRRINARLAAETRKLADPR
jgi:tetratricopeptide (TPR) repeat protein/xanthosine utilization system XapX-like protein